jgi:hypothetical protein
MFGFKIVREDEYNELEKAATLHQRVYTLDRWFSGWKDLDIIWNYLTGKDNTSDTWSLRQSYADKRKTGIYGTTLEEQNSELIKILEMGSNLDNYNITTFGELCGPVMEMKEALQKAKAMI